MVCTSLNECYSLLMILKIYFASVRVNILTLLCIVLHVRHFALELSALSWCLLQENEVNPDFALSSCIFVSNLTLQYSNHISWSSSSPPTGFSVGGNFIRFQIIVVKTTIVPYHRSGIVRCLQIAALQCEYLFIAIKIQL